MLLRLVVLEVMPPLLLTPRLPRGAEAALVNFGVADLEDAGGLSTKDVSVVLQYINTT